MVYIEFIETSAFSKARKSLMEDDEFRELQTFLLEGHEYGDTISQTGGCKKIRWGRQGMGKQGGIRVIYYVRTASGRLYLLLIYPKNAKDDLSPAEKAIMKKFTQLVE